MPVHRHAPEFDRMADDLGAAPGREIPRSSRRCGRTAERHAVLHSTFAHSGLTSGLAQSCKNLEFCTNLACEFLLNARSAVGTFKRINYQSNPYDAFDS
jgi:hypothetical protein